MPRVRLSARARADLVEIWLYIAQDSPAAADRLVDRFYRTCQRLARAPGMGRPRPELAAGLRSFPVGNYVVFYRPGRNGVAIARVLSGYRDIDRLF